MEKSEGGTVLFWNFFNGRLVLESICRFNWPALDEIERAFLLINAAFPFH
jgi:hypothetical protein